MTRATRRRKEVDLTWKGEVVDPSPRKPEIGDKACTGPIQRREVDPSPESYRKSAPLKVFPRNPEIGDMASAEGSRRREIDLSLEAYRASPAWEVTHQPEIRDMASTRGTRRGHVDQSLEAYRGSPPWVVSSHHPEIVDMACTRVVDRPTQLTSGAKDIAEQSANTRATWSRQRVRLGEFNQSMIPSSELLENARKRLNDLSDVDI